MSQMIQREVQWKRWYDRDPCIDYVTLSTKSVFYIKKMFKINFDNYFWIQISLYNLFFITLMISGEYYIWSECNVCQNDSKHHWYTTISLLCKKKMEINSKMNLCFVCSGFFFKLPLEVAEVQFRRNELVISMHINGLDCFDLPGKTLL